MASGRLLRDLHALPLLRRILAAGRGGRLYVTGGFLRDRLIGAKPKAELDLTVDDPPGLLDRLALRRGESFFLMDAERDTFRLVFSRPGPFRWIDLTRLRAESIEEDLLLRDFTVNALAVEIGDGGPRGRIIDPAGGRADLRKRSLRHCSPRSFSDDPLRLLRGVRFEANLGFRLAAETMHLMKGSPRGVRTVAAERVRDELFQILQGPAPLKGLKRIAELRLLGHLGSPFDSAPSASPRQTRRLLALLKEFHPRSTVSRELGRSVDQVATRRGMLLLAAWLQDTKATEKSTLLLRRLALGKKAQASLCGGLETVIPLSHLRRPGSADRAALLDLFHRSHGAVEEAVLLRACDLSPAKERKEAVKGFLGRYGRAKKIFLRPPLLTGGAALLSLPVSPGCALGRLLGETRRAQDLGRVRTAASALRWARRELARSD